MGDEGRGAIRTGSVCGSIEGLSERAAARRFGLDPRTVNKMMKFSVPPGYVRKKAPAKPKLDPFIPMIDSILRDDKLRPKKQQHTASSGIGTNTASSAASRS